jgi:VCBS repeat-containing protein
LRSYASDVDSSVFTSSIVSGPVNGVLVANADGSYSYIPNENYFGVDSFSYTVNDGELESNIATVSLNVGAVNDAPVVINAELSTQEDTALTIDLRSYASDVDSSVFTSSIVSGPVNGVLVANADGTYSYTPNENYFGTDSFTYTVNDGELDSNIATVSLNVGAVNDAPVAIDSQATVNEDTPLTLNPLASVVDVDSTVLTTIIVAGPQHGQLLINADGSFNYVAAQDYFGTDSYTYKVSDGELASNIVTVSLTIAAVNDAPVAISNTVTGVEDTPYLFTWSDFQVSDVDSTELEIVVNTLPANGLLQYFDGLRWVAVVSGQRLTRTEIDAGNFIFGPDLNESGFDGYNRVGSGNNLNNYANFSYQVSDGYLFSELTTLSINIIPLADEPTLSLAVKQNELGATSKLFSTSWETANNRSRTFTIIPKAQLEGWRVVKEVELDDDYHHDRNGDGHYDEHDATEEGQEAFVIWSSGDKMKDSNHTNRIVKSAAGNGNNWLELGDAAGLGHQTYGIERAISTRAGATYNLSLDYAGRLGYSVDFTRIGIYLDGVKIGTYASVSPNTALNWENINFSFTGNGTLQTLRIKADGLRSESNGRGAMIDDILLTEALPINTGYQDLPIRLSTVIAELTDIDGSEVLAVTIGAIPNGAVLSDGIHHFTANSLSSLASVGDWDLSNLSITPAAGYIGVFNLTVAASTTELATGAVASYAITLQVTVVPSSVVSPLVIDLNGDGVKTTALEESSGALGGRFDLLNNGHAIRSGWISKQDGFLAYDINGNGKIDDRNELFGGQLGEGYGKLARFDSNRDGVVDSKDARFNDLKVWQDANGNHQTDAGELRSLKARNISSVNVNHTIVPEEQNGNWLLERGTIKFSDGRTAEVADAYFEIETDAVSKAVKQAQRGSASIILQSKEVQVKEILGLSGNGHAIDWNAKDQLAPLTNWSYKPAALNFAAADDSAKEKAKIKAKEKATKAKPDWVVSFIGAEKEADQSAASLSKLTVNLKGKGKGKE